MTAWYFRYELKFTSPEVDLLWSKLPVEKDGTVSFAHLVEFSFLNFNVTTAGEESGQAASGECIFSIKETFTLSRLLCGSLSLSMRRLLI